MRGGLLSRGWTVQHAIAAGGLIVASASGACGGSEPSGIWSAPQTSANGSSASSGTGSGGSSSGSLGSAATATGGTSSSATLGSSGTSTGTSGSSTSASASNASTSSRASGSDSGAADARTAAGDASDSLAAARALCVQIINQDRASLSPASPALTDNPAQEPCVDAEAQTDYTNNSPHYSFIHYNNCKSFAEDECPDWGGSLTTIVTNCLKQMWAEGPPEAGQDNHWLNMSNKSYTKVACGFYQEPNGHWWATQDFW
jgi:hypothetical protein